MVTTAIPASLGVAASAASTSSSIANIRSRRSSEDSCGASRSLARSSSLIGTTAQKSMSKTSAARHQHRSCQCVAIPEGQHQGARQADRDTERGAFGGIRFISDEYVEYVGVMPGDSRGADRETELGHDLGSRALDRLAAYDR